MKRSIVFKIGDYKKDQLIRDCLERNDIQYQTGGSFVSHTAEIVFMASDDVWEAIKEELGLQETVVYAIFKGEEW